MEEKKKRRRDYLNDFKRDEHGRYEYKGKQYAYQGDDLGRRRFWLGVLCAVMAVLMTAAGCMDAPGMRGGFYVLLPYMAGLVGAAGVCLAVYRFCTGGDPMKAYAYEAGLKKIPMRAAFAATCAALAAVGEVFYAFRNGAEGELSGFVGFLALEVAAAVISAFVWKASGVISGRYCDHVEALAAGSSKE